VLFNKKSLKAKTMCTVDGTISKWPNGMNKPSGPDLSISAGYTLLC